MNDAIRTLARLSALTLIVLGVLGISSSAAGSPPQFAVIWALVLVVGGCTVAALKSQRSGLRNLARVLNAIPIVVGVVCLFMLPEDTQAIFLLRVLGGLCLIFGALNLAGLFVPPGYTRAPGPEITVFPDVKKQGFLGLNRTGLVVFIVLLIVFFPVCWIPWVLPSLRVRRSKSGPSSGDKPTPSRQTPVG